MTDNRYLFSLAGLSISLAGFSGLVVAFRRGRPVHAIDAYRRGQIPEIGLMSALLAIVTIPLVETIGVALAVRLMAAAAAGFAAAHAATLWARRRRMQIRQTWRIELRDDVVLLAIAAGAGFSMALGTFAAYEWLLAAMLARPMVAFVMVLTDASTS